MQAEHRFVCTLPNGLHARPASILAECASGFQSQITITRQCGEHTTADLRSVLSVVGLDVHQGDPCLLTAKGDDATLAIEALRELTEHTLEEIEEAAEAPIVRASGLPVILHRLGVEHTLGHPICAGAAIGIVVHAGGFGLSPEARDAVAQDPTRESQAVIDAITRVRQDLDHRARSAGNRTESTLLEAYRQISEDPALRKSIIGHIDRGATAPQAVLAAAKEFIARLRSASSRYIRDRAVDVQDIAMQILDQLLPSNEQSTAITLTEPSIVFAESLTANQLLRMDRALLKGLVLGSVGQTSHTVILARNLGVPCIIEVARVETAAQPGTPVVVDGVGGFVITHLTDEVRAYYDHEHRAHQRRLQRLLPLAARPAQTHDGHHLEVGTNATDAAEITSAITMGADGIGLYRTEFLFLDRDDAPNEQEQLDTYAAAIRAANGRPIIFRTFDIGGDKPAPYMSFADEENPFLGCRGLRLYPHHQHLLDTQIRALLRAGASAPAQSVKIMAPMVSTPIEARWFRDHIRRIESDLRKEGINHAADVPVGVMIEVPSAALCIDQLSEYVDFFSIGTNDLCQYTMAADRGNLAVSELCDPHHPAFLRLLRLIAREAHAHQRWIGICGELGGRLLDLPLMIGLGVNEISASSNEVVRLKLAVAQANASRCRELLNSACASQTPEEVEALLREPTWKAEDSASLPVIDQSCIEIGNAARSKEYAIKSAVDLLAIAGRTDRPRVVEEAIWAREATYSTGLGHGFAIPHCKCDAIEAPTLAVLRLAHPVEWGSMDDLPVHTVLMLTVPSDEAASGGGAGHMKVFAALARKLMHEQFRDGLVAAANAEEIERFLREQLDLQ